MCIAMIVGSPQERLGNALAIFQGFLGDKETKSNQKRKTFTLTRKPEIRKLQECFGNVSDIHSFAQPILRSTFGRTTW